MSERLLMSLDVPYLDLEKVLDIFEGSYLDTDVVPADVVFLGTLREETLLRLMLVRLVLTGSV